MGLEQGYTFLISSFLLESPSVAADSSKLYIIKFNCLLFFFFSRTMSTADSSEIYQISVAGLAQIRHSSSLVFFSSLLTGELAGHLKLVALLTISIDEHLNSKNTQRKRANSAMSTSLNKYPTETTEGLFWQFMV